MDGRDDGNGIVGKSVKRTECYQQYGEDTSQGNLMSSRYEAKGEECCVKKVCLRTKNR